MAKGDNSGKLLAVISYIPIVGLILLFVEKKNKFVIFHAKHGTALLAVEIIIAIIAYIPVLSLIGGILGLIAFIVAIYGIILALTDKETKIPVLTELGNKIAKLLGK